MVKNYYSLPLDDLDKSINEIRWWLFNYPKHEQYPKAEFALKVALCAQRLERTEETQLIIDSLIVPIYT
jgi:hypothetical protein